MTDEELREQLQAALANDGRLELMEVAIPARTLEGLRDYELHYYDPGDFLTAVLSNDLFEAFGRADEKNTRAMLRIVIYVWNTLPRQSWGSPEKVKAWLAQRVAPVETDAAFCAKQPF